MASVRMATGSVLATITDSANAVSSVVNTFSSSLAMLNDYVARQRGLQQERAIVENTTFRTQLVQEANLEITQRQEKIDQYLEGNPRRKEIYDQSNAALLKAFADYDKRNAQPEAE